MSPRSLPTGETLWILTRCRQDHCWGNTVKTGIVTPRLEKKHDSKRGMWNLGLLVYSEIVLSTRYGPSYGKTMVFINNTLVSTETSYQQDLINRDLLSTSLIVGKVGPGISWTRWGGRQLSPVDFGCYSDTWSLWTSRVPLSIPKESSHRQSPPVCFLRVV